MCTQTHQPLPCFKALVGNHEGENTDGNYNNDNRNQNLRRKTMGGVAGRLVSLAPCSKLSLGPRGNQPDPDMLEALPRLQSKSQEHMCACARVETMQMMWEIVHSTMSWELGCRSGQGCDFQGRFGQMEGLRRRARTVPAVSSLPLQVMVYYNIQYALMYVVAILASHIHKVRLC